MNLELILQNEVSQKEKNKYHILIYIYGISKNGIDKSIFREGMEMQTGNRLMDTVGKERVRQMKKV